MPSKNSPRFKRPPSPYSVSQSPRYTNKIWRPLNGTGQPNVSNSFAQSSKEIWLRSLRQGTDVKRNPMRAGHPHSGNVNTSLSSSPEYLREQLGLPISRRHKRSNSVGESPGTPQYKSQEDMYDEILALKKALLMSKNDLDVSKAKTRRLEEDNARKEKYIAELLDPKMSADDIRKLAEGKSESGGSTVARLKQRLLKLEKQLRDKERELVELKSDLKTTDIEEMKSAMEIYYQEVLRMRDIASSHMHESERLQSSLHSERETQPSKIKILRKNILQLTANNNRLMEENQSLKRDLDHVLDDIDDDEEDTSIKYSSLSKAELISIIKKLKQSERQKNETNQRKADSEQERLKSLIANLKEERTDLRAENEKLCEENSECAKVLKDQRHENEVLLRRLEEYVENENSSEIRRQEIRRQSKDQLKRSSSFEKNKAAISIQRQWRKHRESDRRKKSGDIVLLQSALRAHLSRSSHLNKEQYGLTHEDLEDSELSDSSEDAVLIQSAMRGHLQRTSRAM